MKIVNQYIVKYRSSLSLLYEVEDGRFFIKFTTYTMQGWKEQTKEVDPEEVPGLITE